MIKIKKKKFTDLNYFCYFKEVANILCTVNIETLIFLFDDFLYKDLTDSELVKRSFHENINHIKCHIYLIKMQFNRCCLFRFCRHHYEEEKDISLFQEIHILDQVTNMNYPLLSAEFDTSSCIV